ncbi:MAG: glycosyltransferase family A protein, partial [Bacteroidota bacterium]
MNAKALHSFGVLAFKDSPYLPACLDSLKNQTVKSEIYITTSTPSPYLEKIATEYGVELYITDAGKGIAHDWNFCFQKAQTKYLTLAHQDDIYLPEYTAKCLIQGENHDDVQICFTNYVEIVNDKIRSGTMLLRIKTIIITFFFLF